MSELKFEIKVVEAPTYEDAKLLSIIDKDCFPDDAMEIHEWSSALTDMTTVFYAQAEDHILGAAVLTITPFKIGYLYSTAVFEEYRRNHIAYTLLQERLEYCADHAITLVQAHTRTDNIPSGRLLEQFGFKPINYVPDFYADFEDGILWSLQNTLE